MTVKIVRPLTRTIHPDEPCYRISEMDLVLPPSHQRKRWRIYTVVRDDELADYFEDTGPSDDAHQPVVVLSLFEYTVAECKDMADRVRYTDNYWEQREIELRGSGLHDWLSVAQRNPSLDYGVHDALAAGLGLAPVAA